MLVVRPMVVGTISTFEHFKELGGICIRWRLLYIVGSGLIYLKVKIGRERCKENVKMAGGSSNTVIVENTVHLKT